MRRMRKVSGIIHGAQVPTLRGLRMSVTGPADRLRTVEWLTPRRRMPRLQCRNSGYASNSGSLESWLIEVTLMYLEMKSAMKTMASDRRNAAT